MKKSLYKMVKYGLSALLSLDYQQFYNLKHIKHRKFLYSRRLLFMLITFIIGSAQLSAQTSGGPDDFGYTWRSSDHTSGPAYQWNSVVGLPGAVKITADYEYCTDEVTIPGGFKFYGVNYNSLYIGDNGWLNFLAKQYSPYHPFIYEGGAPNALIAPFAEDLNGARGRGIYYYNDAANNRFIIQYDSIPRFYNNGYHSFQVVLDKNDTTVTYYYRKSDNWHYTDGISGLPVTGIENHLGTTGININNSILKDNLAIKFYQPAPYIYYNPASVNFSNTWVGKSDSTEVTLLNSGKKDLLITSIALKSGVPFSISGLPVGFPGEPIVINEVNSGDFQKFFIRFTPADQYSVLDTLIVRSNSANADSLLKIPLSATSLKATLSVLTPSLSFGSVQIEYRSTKDMNVILKNTGTAGLLIKETSALVNNTIFKIVKLPSALPFSIPAGLQDTIVVRFAPTSTGVKTDTLKLYNSSTNLPLAKIPLTGTGAASLISFSPVAAVFDSTVQGVTATKTVRISNPGTYALTVSSISLLHNESYSLPGTPTTFTINPGLYRDVQIAFTPVKTGLITDSIKIISNLPDVYHVSITGTGILPVLTLQPDILDFGQVLLGSLKNDSITIRNTGSGTLSISSIALTTTGSFAITSTFSYPVKIYAGGMKRVKLKFEPSSLGFVYNNLKVVSNSGTLNAQLIGKGVFPAIEITKPSILYGAVPVETVKNDSLYIKNNGSADLIISSISFDNGQHFKLAQQPVLPLTVAPGSNYKLKISFIPLTAASLQDKITIINNAGAAQQVALSGTGTLPGIVYQPTLLQFDSTLENSVSSKYLWLKNTGNQSLDITSLSTKTTQFEVYSALKNRPESSLRGSNNLNLNINPGDSLRLRVEFKPNSNIFFTDSLITVAAVIGRSSLPLSGQGTRAAYQLSAAQLTYGDQTINSTASQNVNITNSGNGRLYIQSLSSQNTVFKLIGAPVLPLLLYPGQSRNLQIEFKPVAFGAAVDTLNILTNSSQGLAKVPLSGYGRGGALSLSGTLLNYGNVGVGNSKKDSIYIRNYGNAPLTVSSVTIDQANGIMTVESPSVLPTGISAGDSLKVRVRFTPTAVINYQKLLTVSSNSVFNNPNQVELNGSGVSAAIYITPNHLDYGYVHLDSLKSDSITVYNNGTANLIITALSLTGSGSFGLENPPALPITVLPGGNYKLKIRFTALSAGLQSGVLNIINNAVNNVQVNLSGYGALGSLAASATALNFSAVNVGSEIMRSVYLKNSGTYRLKINSISTTGTVFSVANNMSGYNLEAGDSVKAEVYFKPLFHQNYFDFLVVESEVGDLSIQLQGTGLQSYLEVGDPQIAFGTVSIGQSLQQEVKLYNHGNKVLSVSALEFTTRAIFGYSGITLPVAINAGDSMSFNLQFSPALPIGYTDSLKIISNSPVAGRVALSGFGSGANLVLGQSLINFGEAVIGSFNNKLLQLTNTGNSNLIIDSLYSTLQSAFILNNGNPLSLPLIIPAGGSYQLEIKFQPLNVTSYQAKIRIHSNSYDLQSDFCSLIGYGVSANIVLNPGSLDYGIVKTGATSLKYLKVTNTGNSVLNIDSLKFRHGVSFALSSQFTYPIVIAAGSSQNIGIAFQPAGVQHYQDTLDIFNNSDNGVYGVFSGHGGQPQFAISANLLEFGDVTVGTVKTLALFLKNTGNYPGVFDSYTNQNPAFILTLGEKIMKRPLDKLIMNIQPGDSVLLNVRLNPPAMSLYSDTVIIKAENFTGKTALNGRGVKAILTAQPASLAFGDVTINTLKCDTMEISNSGNVDLVITSLDLVNKKGFIIRNYQDLIFPLIIQPGLKISLCVDFLPTELVTYTEKIKVTSNNFQQPVGYLYLTGAGKSSNLSVTPTFLDYGSIELGNIVTKSVMVKNAGNTNLTVSSIGKQLGVYKLLNVPVMPLVLIPGQQFTFNVQFMPNLPQVFNDTVKIVTSTIQANVVLTGTGAYPACELSASALNFDSVFVNNSSIKRLMIKNPGTSTLNINSITHKLPVYTYTAGSKAVKKTTVSARSVYSILPGDSLPLLIAFTPLQTINYQDTLNISTNAGTRAVVLTGKGARAALTVNTNLVQFEATAVGAMSYDSIVVKNRSMLTLQINSLTISNNLIFRTEEITLPQTLTAGDSLVIRLNFQPLQLADYAAVLTLYNNSGYNPQITLKGSGLSGDLQLSALSDDFGPVSVGDLVTDSLYLKNKGTAPLVLNDLRMAAGMHYQLLSSLSLPLELTAGDSVYVRYRFNPQSYSVNELKDTIKILTSVENASCLLHGRSVNVFMSFNPAELNYGEVYKDYADTLNVKAKNTGEGRILISEIALLHGSPFIAEFNPFTILNTGMEANIRLIYHPTALGEYADSLKFSLNGTIRYLKITGLCSDSVSIAEPVVPVENSVFNNYPNPFNSTTVLPYAVKETAFVTLQIFNGAGQQIRRLEAKHQLAGYYNFSLSLADLSAGIYYYKLTINQDYQKSGRMMLVK